MSEVTLALVLVMVAAITPLLSLTLDPLSTRLTCAWADHPQSNTVQLQISGAKRGDLILNLLDSMCFELLPDRELRRVEMTPVIQLHTSADQRFIQRPSFERRQPPAGRVDHRRNPTASKEPCLAPSVSSWKRRSEEHT